MKRYSENVHEQAMWDAMQEMKRKRLQVAGRLIPISFMTGWAIVLICAMFS